MSASKIAIVVGIINILLSSGLVYLYLTAPQIAYIRTEDVFQGYKGKEELANKFQQESLQRKQGIDSLTAYVRVLQQQPNNQATLEKVLEEYQQKVMEYERTQQKEQAQYTDAIWKQINEYVRQFGEANNYEHILGATGNGSLMYSKQSQDITLLVIEYINRKYEGK